MHRRSFMKTAGGLFAGLALSRFAVSREIDLIPFCDDDHYFQRWDLSQPFEQAGRVIAMDGRVLVSVASATCDLADEETRLPDISHLPLGTDGGWQRWPEKKLIHDMTSSSSREPHRCCPVCDQRGRIGPGVKVCPDCESDGFVNVECDDIFGDGSYFDDCKRCQTTGYIGGVQCDYCAGKGSTDNPCVQAVGDLLIAGGMDRKVRKLPGVMWRHIDWSCDRRANRLDPADIIAIKFDGGEGLLIPLELKR